jgi:tetratricopeptide (TPR) repeat protein
LTLIRQRWLTERQLAQYYQGAGDLSKALEYGDKALTSAPRNLDIIVSQASIAQQMKNNSKLLDYSVRGGEVYNSIDKTPKPEGLSDQDFASQKEQQKTAAKNSYDLLEAAAFNVIVDESNAKARMAEIERFTPAFPNSRFDEPVTSYAMMALSELKDTARVVSYGEKVLATNPNSLPTLLMLAVLAEIRSQGALERRLHTLRRQSLEPRPMLRMRTAPTSSPAGSRTPLWVTPI